MFALLRMSSVSWLVVVRIFLRFGGRGRGLLRLTEAITVEQLKQASAEEIQGLLPHPRTLLPEMPCVTVDEQVAGRLRNGMQVNLPDFSSAPLVKVFASPTELIAIVRRVAGTLMQPTVVMG